MRFTVLLSLLLAARAQAAPNDAPVDAELQKRQDYSALLGLASSAGISLPTDNPGLLLSLAPVAAQLASYLPTAPVLSALQTAAPSGFLSNIIHDPSYAASFESQFAAGKSPSWFQALPSSVKGYLHTYSDYGGVASQVGHAESIISTAAASASASASKAASAGATATGTDVTLETGAASASSGAAAGSGNSSGGGAATTTSDTSAAASGSSASASDASTAAASSTASAQSSAAASSSASTGSAPRETAAVAAGIAAVAGVLGLAIAL